jgi:rubredoxin
MEYRSWMCLICGWIYDEEAGLPEEGIAPGTRWEDVPINWTCPECGARKEDFERVFCRLDFRRDFFVTLRSGCAAMPARRPGTFGPQSDSLRCAPAPSRASRPGAGQLSLQSLRLA